MNTAILYSKHEDITEKSFILKIRTVSQLLSPGGSLSLICFDGEEDIKNILKKATRNNDVLFLTEQVVSVNGAFIAKILKGSNFGYYKKSIVAVLHLHENQFFDTVAHILYSCAGDGNAYAFDYVDISEKSLDEATAIISAECLFINPKLYAIELENLVRILIIAESDAQSSADILCNETVQNLKMLFGDNAFSNHFEDITATVVELLNRHNLKVATAESCTAGMLSSAITSVPGASAVFEIGISSYADRIKKAALGVSAATLRKYGAVSMQTAAEMARGIKLLSDADIGVSATGVAGPGSSEYKPVGTVYIALTDGKKNWVVDLNLDSTLSRDEIRSKTTFACLDLLRRYLQCLPSVLPDGTDIDAPLFLLYEQPHFEPQLANVSETAEESETLSNDQIGFTVNENFLDLIPAENKNKVKFNFDIKPIFEKINNFISVVYQKCKEILSDKEKVKKFSINSVFAVIIASILLGSLSVYSYFSASNKNQAIIDELRAEWNYTGDIDANGNFADFNNFVDINSDISGWITIGNNAVDLPVCLTDDNDFYKNHNYKKQSSRYGALYFLGNLKPTDSTAVKNTVICGNAPADSSMFAPLKNYRSIEFLQENTNIELITKYSRRLYQVFAVMIIDSKNTDDFDYTVTDFTDSESFNQWIGEVSIRSLYKLDATLPDSYDTITLITDTDEFDGAKLVVVGYSVNWFDEAYSQSLKVNPSPYYPQAWYDAHSSVNPYSDSKPIPDISTETSETPPLVIVPGIDNDTSSDSSSTPTESNPDDTVSNTTSSTASSTSSTTSSSVNSNTSSNTTVSDTSSSNSTSENTSSSTDTDNTSSDTVSDDTSSDVTSDTISDTTESDSNSDN